MIENVFPHTGKLRNMASVYLYWKQHFLLLFRQGDSIVNNLWIGSAGGHFIDNELNNAKACVLRELNEELGIPENMVSNLSLRYITLRYTDEEVRQNYYFFAEFPCALDLPPKSNEGYTQWFSMDALSTLPMPYTARFVIDHYTHIGQFNKHLYGGIANNNGIVFETL